MVIYIGNGSKARICRYCIFTTVATWYATDGTYECFMCDYHASAESIAGRNLVSDKESKQEAGDSK